MTPPVTPSSRPRDLRLDFFRGSAMFIILFAHTPGNPWTLWIPARFGFSDATEMFVFCSGFASALAFYDGYRRGRLPANLIQAQRDYFGGHTYERTDRPRGEHFHTDWTGRGGDVSSRTYDA